MSIAVITVTRCDAPDRPVRINARRILSIGPAPRGCRILFDTGDSWDVNESAAKIEEAMSLAIG